LFAIQLIGLFLNHVIELTVEDNLFLILDCAADRIAMGIRLGEVLI